MANDLNSCTFIGNLGSDPESRQVGDTSVTNFSIAVGWKTKNKEGTEWVRCGAWGKLGEICQQYLKKGSKVYIQGAMQTREYEKDGIKRYSTEIRVDNMQMLDSKGSTKVEDYAIGDLVVDSVGDTYRAISNPQAPAPKDDFNSDIPF
jgi:single-strand DNA-binding protein